MAGYSRVCLLRRLRYDDVGTGIRLTKQEKDMGPRMCPTLALPQGGVPELEPGERVKDPGSRR